MDDIFDHAVAIVLAHEGGYVNDPSDRGGETKFGISKRQYPDEDIANLTIERAKAIYMTDFWLRYRLNQISDDVAPKVLDAAVLCGPGTAIKMLQRCLGVTADGAIGPGTVAACRAALSLLDKYREALADHFHAIAAGDPSQARFLKGWLARAAT